MPKTVDVQERQATIAEACWRVIASRGIADVTTRAVAREAGIGAGVLFHYFRDKDDLVNVAFELLQERFREHMRAMLSDASTSLERLRLVARCNLPLDPSRNTEFAVWLALWAHTYSSERLRRQQREVYERWREVLTNMVSDAIHDGFLRADLNPAIAAVQLAGLTDGLVVQLLIEDEGERSTIDAGPAVDALIDGWIAVSVVTGGTEATN